MEIISECGSMNFARLDFCVHALHVISSAIEPHLVDKYFVSALKFAASKC